MYGNPGSLPPRSSKTGDLRLSCLRRDLTSTKKARFSGLHYGQVTQAGSQRWEKPQKEIHSAHSRTPDLQALMGYRSNSKDPHQSEEKRNTQTTMPANHVDGFKDP